jgi:hypothetical protein
MPTVSNEERVIGDCDGCGVLDPRRLVGRPVPGLGAHFDNDQLQGRTAGGVNAILKHLGIAFPPAPSERIKGIARDPARKGARIEAIKAYREETGLGLKEAKDAVDNWLATKSG